VKYLFLLNFALLMLFVSCGGSDNEEPEDETMVSVPAGEFIMGCNSEVDKRCYDNEHPVHTVKLSEYKIDKYEVTAGEYKKCIDAGNCNNKNADEPHYEASVNDECNIYAADKGNHPMNCVSWFGAKAYCEWVGKKLPTEAQWEKAARGTQGLKYPWGNEPEANCEYAVISVYNSETDDYDNGCGKDGTWIVGSKEKGKSPYGVYDMIGNVEEWVDDYYAENYYENSPLENPAGPDSGEHHSIRSGSFSDNTDTWSIRASARNDDTPESDRPSLGFRCVK